MSSILEARERMISSRVSEKGEMAAEELVAALKAKALDAQERVYRLYAEEILELSTRLLRSHDDAADLLHDTFIVAFGDIGGLREPSALRFWLRKVCVRLAHRHFRKRKILRAFGFDRTVEDAELHVLVDPSAGPDVKAELRKIDNVLATLAENDRTAWVLRYVEGHQLEDVADLCSCSLATAKRRVSAAHETIVQRIGVK